MISYYKENTQLFLILIVWLLVGMFASPASFVLIPITLLLLYRKRMYEELIIGYFFILILSDSLESSLFFAKSIKNVYISVLALFFFLDLDSFQPLHRLYKIFIPFFLFSFITIFISLDEPFFATGFQKTVSFALSFIVLPGYFLKLYRDEGVDFLRRLIFFCVTILALGFLFTFVGNEITYLANGRYRGMLGSPNGLGIYSVLTLIAYLFILDIHPEAFTKREKMIILFAILLSIYLSGSRNSVIAVLIFIVFHRFFGVSPFLGFILFLLTLFLTELITSNLTVIVTYLGISEYFRLNTLEEGSGRYIAWEFAWRHIQKNFFIGKGFAYNEYYMRQNYGLLSKLGHQGGIHNSFLTFWMDQGLIGLLIYLRSYILIFIKGAQTSRYAFPALFALSFTAVFESWLLASLSPFAFLALFIFAIMTMEERVVAKESGSELIADSI